MPNSSGAEERGPNRRRVLQIFGIGGAALAIALPARWTRPVVQSIVVPAHAAASPANSSTTRTTASTTTPIGTSVTTATTGTTGISTTNVPSDRRLKRDVAAVGHCSAGFALYRYRYVWSDQLYVGVMAQDVQKAAPAAVHCGEDGYLRVDYERLGLRLVTWDEWLESHERRPERRARAARAEAFHGRGRLSTSSPSGVAGSSRA
jgi:hypothetical protein